MTKLKQYLAEAKRLWAELKDFENNAKRLEAQADARAFMPAVLEIQETPPSHTVRILLCLICGFFTVAVLWASFGKVDVVAVAQGKIIPSGHVKVIQPVETGVVKAIHVTDGQSVAEGDVLLELDVTATEADRQRLASDLATSRANVARMEAMLAGKKMILPEGTSDAEASLQRQLQQQEEAEYAANIQNLRDTLNQRRAELAAVQKRIVKIQTTLPSVAKRAGMMMELAEQGYASRLRAMGMDEERTNLEGDLTIEKSNLEQAKAAISGAEQNLNSALAEWRKTTLGKLSEEDQKRTGLENELSKAERRNALYVLKAPVSGKVQQLAVHTIGGVVTPAQELMHIVPFDAQLEAEVSFQNKDIGFVEPGQTVAVKVEAFPFTTYGLLEGQLTNVSLDAVADEKKGLMFPARVGIKQASIDVNGKAVPLTPGMAITAEVKTDKRRIISYFLSPLLRYKQEAIRER